MVLGTMRASIHIPQSRSLKDKRRVVKSLIDTMRARHNVAVAEIEDQDTLNHAVLGIACVSTDIGHAHSILESVARGIDRCSDSELVRYRIEML